MKKIIILISIFIAGVMWLAFSSAEGISTSGEECSTNSGQFILPSGLEEIGEGAFSGTGVVSVELSKDVVSIGEDAFADNPGLVRIRFLGENTSISNNIFGESRELLIEAPAGSIARLWAERHGYPFSLIPLFKERTQRKNDVWIISERKDKPFLSRQQESCLAEKKQEQQGRTLGELKASRYKGVAAIHIQSRFFP